MESWRPLQGVEINHPHSSHTCCLHLHHREAEQPQQQKNKNNLKKHNRKSPTKPAIFPVDIQAKPDVLPLSLVPLAPDYSNILLHLYFSLPPLCLPSSSFLPFLQLPPFQGGRVSWVMEVTLLISSICPLPWFSTDLRASPMGLTACQSLPHISSVTSPAHMIGCYQMFEYFELKWPLCFKRRKYETQLESLNLSFAEQH